ncbi:MAG: 2-succinyl-5-enolpyruvyl-6-hydroxy-3-cyclohexene-1-carboxylic-acid synthase, partial [Bacteroidales bacterium]|nr:2-succinyl-5-enolpyruvyl-6-hydroxy-3-cyclohexene-1-carboxylic-acid synthase [Bacteroidales bacterium]
MNDSEFRTFRTTEKAGCRLIGEAMEAYGVKHVVLSPGSRNAPLIMVFARNKYFKTYSVIDERSAAFVALGIAEISCEPVAIVCTSGSAILNYAPALSEAYYRHLPLIAISADRPEEWIDQNDSQTIRQLQALSQVVRGSVCIKGELYNNEEIEFANRKINDILQLCVSGVRGPVHINVPLSMPLTNEYNDNITRQFHKIDRYDFTDKIPVEAARDLAFQVHGKKLLITGFISLPDNRLNKAIGTLAALPNVAVVCEGLSNIHAMNVLNGCDTLFPDSMNEEQLKFLSPDIIISFGGAPVSAKFKKFLRRCNSAIHWHVGKSDNAIDCFRKLTARIELNPEGFFPRFASSLAHISRNSEKKGDYAEIWKRYVQSVTVSSGVKKQLPPMQFNAMSAVDYILQSMPSNWNIQLGNGMAVRYGLVSDHLCRFHRVDSNRGVSGIDGCLSTAIGASCAYSGNTLLIIGDMSTEYDLSAFFSGLITQKLKIVVLNNGGGGIFHYVNTTRNLPEL